MSTPTGARPAPARLDPGRRRIRVVRMIAIRIGRCAVRVAAAVRAAHSASVPF